MQSEQQQRIMGYFIEEAKDHLNTIEQGLLNLQGTIEDPEMVNEVFRAAHSVKGGAAMLGLNSIQHAAHRLEDYFKILKECPVQIDQALETLFLKVFDALQELLEQLQGPFGLTDEKSAEVMAGVEPVFQDLNRRFSGLLGQSGGSLPEDVDLSIISSVNTSHATPSPTVSAASEDSALQLIFQSDVPVRLREMLQLFKQADNSDSRRQLQELCLALGQYGDPLDVPGWCQLLDDVRQAIANPNNSYRALAPVIIKEVKQAQELVLAGRSSEIVTSQNLRELLPAQVEVQDEFGSEFDNLLSSMDFDSSGDDLTLSGFDSFMPMTEGQPEEQISASADAADDSWFSEAIHQSAPEIQEPETLEPILDTAFNSQELDSSLDFATAAPAHEELDSEFSLDFATAAPTHAPTHENVPDLNLDILDEESLSGMDDLLDGRSGPEVGIAELNSLADLFEGEMPDLGLTWQQEEIVSDIRESSNAAVTGEPDQVGEFSDLLFDQDSTEDLVLDDLAEEDLSGLLDSQTQQLSQSSVASADELLSSNPLNFLNDELSHSQEESGLADEQPFVEDVADLVGLNLLDEPIAETSDASLGFDLLNDFDIEKPEEPGETEDLLDLGVLSEVVAELSDDPFGLVAVDDDMAQAEPSDDPFGLMTMDDTAQANELLELDLMGEPIAEPSAEILHDEIAVELNWEGEESEVDSFEELLEPVGDELDLSSSAESAEAFESELELKNETDTDLVFQIDSSETHSFEDSSSIALDDLQLPSIDDGLDSSESLFEFNSESTDGADQSNLDLLSSHGEIDFAELTEAELTETGELEAFSLEVNADLTEQLPLNLLSEDQLLEDQSLEDQSEDQSLDLISEDQFPEEQASEDLLFEEQLSEDIPETHQSIAFEFDNPWDTHAGEQEPELVDLQASDLEGIGDSEDLDHSLDLELQPQTETTEAEDFGLDLNLDLNLDLAASHDTELESVVEIPAIANVEDSVDSLNLDEDEPITDNFFAQSEELILGDDLFEENSNPFQNGEPAEVDVNALFAEDSEPSLEPLVEFEPNISEAEVGQNELGESTFELDFSNEPEPSAWDLTTETTETEETPIVLAEIGEVDELQFDDLSSGFPDFANETELISELPNSSSEELAELDFGQNQSEVESELESENTDPFAFDFNDELAVDTNSSSEAIAPVAILEEPVLETASDSFLDDSFSDLDAMLGEVASSPVTTAPNLPISEASAEELDNFDDLDALIGDTPAVPAKVSASIPASVPETIASAATSAGSAIQNKVTTPDEFGDLEDLLKDADQALGGGSASRKAASAPNRRSNRRGVLTDQTMRVSVKHLDNLNNLVGEMVVNRNSLEQAQERLRQFLDNLLYQVQQLSDVGQRMRDLYERSLLESSLLSTRRSYHLTPSTSGFGSSSEESSPNHATGESFDALEMDRFTGFHTLSQEMIELIVRVRESASDIDFVVEESDQVTRNFRQITTQLQEGLTRARMVPFAQTADRLPRGVRDNALKYGKQAELVVEGRETLIDKMIVEQLYDPMTHLVNNAVAHGVETPEERTASGKPPTGKIVLRTFHQGNQTIISVSDDGAGIDQDRVKAKAIAKGLITAAEAKELSRMDTYDLLFHHGFSTADQIDDLKGRGVGLDVVRSNLNEIRGAISIDSTLGKGTTFTIRLPLTLSISKALCCISNRARIAFPMDGVEDMLDVPKERVQTDAQGRPCIYWRDALLPFQPLSSLLKHGRMLGRGSVYGGNQEEDIISVVVLRSGGDNLALQVDQVLGEQEIVIKQLEGPVPKPVGVAGATVLGDGRIMPIADVLELIDLSEGRIRRESGSSLWEMEDQLPADVLVEKTEPTVLIVDDSITVRELLSMTFNKVGYRVEQARDGQEAWEKLRSGLPCDLVFCDIEMPRMDGLELLSRIQKDSSLNHLPIAMLTSRGADRHRQMAVQLGAKGYFTKPYLEEALLDAAQRMLKGEVLVASASVS
jgi:chemotaxis protein histidine kinase CheA/CheY-like chemotaxis protein